MSLRCYNCKEEIFLSSTENIARSEECPKCYVNLRACRMCDFYDKNSYNECREPTAERIVDKEKPNFCDFYKINTGINKEQVKNDALAAANALFKK